MKLSPVLSQQGLVEVALPGHEDDALARGQLGRHPRGQADLGPEVLQAVQAVLRHHQTRVHLEIVLTMVKQANFGPAHMLNNYAD